MTPFPSHGPVRITELLNFRDWEGPALVRILYYMLVISSVLWGLGKWTDLVMDAKFSQTAMPTGYTGPRVQVKSVSLAMARGCFRFLLYSFVGTMFSRIGCELLLSTFVLRDALYQKLRAPDDGRPLVKPVAPVAEGGGFSMGSCSITSSSGYQTVA